MRTGQGRQNCLPLYSLRAYPASKHFISVMVRSNYGVRETVLVYVLYKCSDLAGLQRDKSTTYPTPPRRLSKKQSAKSWKGCQNWNILIKLPNWINELEELTDFTIINSLLPFHLCTCIGYKSEVCFSTWSHPDVYHLGLLGMFLWAWDSNTVSCKVLALNVWSLKLALCGNVPSSRWTR